MITLGKLFRTGPISCVCVRVTTRELLFGMEKFSVVQPILFDDERS